MSEERNVHPTDAEVLDEAKENFTKNFLVGVVLTFAGFQELLDAGHELIKRINAEVKRLGVYADDLRVWTILGPEEIQTLHMVTLIRLAVGNFTRPRAEEAHTRIHEMCHVAAIALDFKLSHLDDLQIDPTTGSVSFLHEPPKN